ncbi:hypothetical protein [Adonisia turfae]|uniref:Uncharacterized protein n=1 Tax=Adonisia turfae CCMR0081 TaxID=2292702 RepID=A0A6M0RP89_9CYAN|nr:hypothetical protein [Adonisia turfae]NEZ57573.1 hypothetical protein [Adonisia turfae CCMR0081]
MPDSNNKPDQLNSPNIEFAKTYYEHQYNRVSKLEEQGLTITNVVISFSVVAFTFGFNANQILTTVTGIVLPLTMIVINIFAITYLISSGDWIETHRSRGKRILKLFAEDIYQLDREVFKERKIRFFGRRRTQILIHTVLIGIAMVPILIYLKA